MRQTYSIVFLDIDGTLLDSHRNISANTKQIINRLDKRGVPVVLCSARCPNGIGFVAKQIELHNSPIICYGGSLILDSDRSILLDTGMAVPVAIRFKQFVDKYFSDVSLCSYLYNIWLVDDADNPDFKYEAEAVNCQPTEGDLIAATQTLHHVHKILCISSPHRIIELQKAAAPLFPELALQCSGPTYLEVTTKDVSKRTAVQVLQERYHLDRENIVACGDHFVDMEMLQYAGLGIAMGNAPEEVQATADQVTASNDEDGVYIALKRLQFTPLISPTRR